MRTVWIEWEETSQHRVQVNVPDKFDAAHADLEDALADLENDGFEGLVREGIIVSECEFEPHAEMFSPG